MQESPPKYEFSVELCPPVDPRDLQLYYDRIVPLLSLTSDVCISSHPVQPDIFGFDRSYNLAKFVLAKQPDINIMLHLTCQDLNRVNIEARLSLIYKLGIRRLLIISGQCHAGHGQYRFRDSSDLIAAIKETFTKVADYDLSLLAVGGYPSTYNTDDLGILAAKISLGANAIMTQCIFDMQHIESFRQDIEKLGSDVHVIPSIAMFDDHESLCKVMRLIRVSSSDHVAGPISNMSCTSLEEQRKISRRHLVNLCRELRAKNMSRINICPFDKFELTVDIMRSLIDEN